MYQKSKFLHACCHLMLSGALLASPVWASSGPLVTTEDPQLSFSWKAISSFDNTVMAINEDGTLWGWGKNADGQIGIGSFEYRNVPTRVGSANDWVYVDAADDWTLAIKADGTLWGWGRTEYLGLGADSGLPEEIVEPMLLDVNTDWVAVSGAWDHSMALRADGTLWTWGDNRRGQLGDGVFENRWHLGQMGADTDWQSIFAGDMYSLAIKKNGTLWAWGNNRQGQLGDGTNTDRSSPVQIGFDSDWIAVTGGYGHTLALKADGSLWSWGKNDRGQLGDGTTAFRAVPVRVGVDNDWAQISADWKQSTALKTDGTLWTWGANQYGSGGDGTVEHSFVPRQVAAAQRWMAVIGGDDLTVAIDQDGGLWSWGRNEHGQLGVGEFGSRLQVPKNVFHDHQWSQIVAGRFRGYGITTAGTLWRWGDPTLQSSYGNSIWETPDTLQQLGIDTNWVGLTSNSSSSASFLALKADGSLWGWGENGNGQLGTGDQLNTEMPTQAGVSSDWLQAAVGSEFGAAVKTNGSLWVWGRIRNADGAFILQLSPVQLGSETDWSEVRIYDRAPNLAIKKDGSLWVWEANLSASPSLLSNEQWQKLTRINGYPAAFKADGSLWQIQGSSGNYDLAEAAGAETWSTLSSEDHTLAIKPDGTLWSWGRNRSGQLGDGTSENQNTPVRVGEDTDWEAVQAVGNNSFGLKYDGSLWAWGRNEYGLLGDQSPRWWAELPQLITEGSQVKDSDGDGIEDAFDDCPMEAPTDGDADGDGCTDSAMDLATLLSQLSSEELEAKLVRSLTAKAEQAQSSLNRGNISAAQNQIEAFIDAVEAQRGKAISDETATMLIDYGNNILAASNS